jgi:hypothetical protein
MTMDTEPVKAVSAELIMPGVKTGILDPDDLTQVWRITFSDGLFGEIHLSPTESIRHKGHIKDMVIELADHLHARDGLSQFPYSTNNLGATLSPYRTPKRS